MNATPNSLTALIVLACLFATGLSLVPAEAMCQKPKRKRMERSPVQELVYENKAYLPSIQSILFHHLENGSDLPMVALGEQETLLFAFDDFRADVRNFYFSIEHCDAQWNSSYLSALEYSEGFNEDRITQYWSSRNTLQPYTHYEFLFPSLNVRPKLPGNYLLKVFEDADKKRLILTQRFYVLQPDFGVSASVVPSSQSAKRLQNQKINLEIQTTGIQIQLPEREIKILAMQNQRPDHQMWVQRPSGIQNQRLVYQDPQTLDFGGGNEFYYVDLRSFQLASEQVASIRKDTAIHISLLPDQNRAGTAYAELFDENGQFFIRNGDRQNAEDETDYAFTTFSLKKPQHESIPEGYSIYLVGGFNFYRLEDRYKLQWNDQKQLYEVTIPLKQGVYDYQYQLADEKGNRLPQGLDGQHFQTRNTYQIFVYYRRPGTTWDELRGFQQINSADSQQ